MREIKFRAWDKSRGKMIYNPSTNAISHINEIFANDKDQDCVWMLFSGMKDRHGKEIYEGDIIQYDYDLHLQYPKEVKYQDGMFRKVSQRQQWNALYIDIDRYEVIGNIYENPGLIGGTQKEEK